MTKLKKTKRQISIMFMFQIFKLNINFVFIASSVEILNKHDSYTHIR